MINSESSLRAPLIRNVLTLLPGKPVTTLPGELVEPKWSVSEEWRSKANPRDAVKASLLAPPDPG